jgi:hypothetical protein
LPSNEKLFKVNKNADILKKINFVKQYPIQSSFFCNIQLDLQKLYFRKTPDDKKIAKKWLSCVNNELKAIYCPICIVFSSSATTFLTVVTISNIFMKLKYMKNHQLTDTQ